MKHFIDVSGGRCGSIALYLKEKKFYRTRLNGHGFAELVDWIILDQTVLVRKFAYSYPWQRVFYIKILGRQCVLWLFHSITPWDINNNNSLINEPAGAQKHNVDNHFFLMFYIKKRTMELQMWLKKIPADNGELLFHIC